VIRDLESFPDDEKQDFSASCNRYGYRASDFCLTSREFRSGQPLERIDLEIKVFHLPSKTTRTYKGGHSSHWTYDFEQDLSRGLFKT
jgi:hypothetical protein